MNVGFDPDRTRRAVERLPPRHRVAFAATCCERLLPNYAAFARIAEWGDPDVLREALEFIWAEVPKAASDPAEVRRRIARCEELVPDTDDFSSDYTSAALDAGTAILETLEALLDPAPRRIVDVASVCRDTVDMFLQEREGSDLDEDELPRDPLMAEEIARQATVLEQLHDTSVLDRSFLDRLRAEAHNGGVSNIGLRG